MTLHLLKSSSAPFALQALSSQTTPSVVVLLPPGDSIPSLSNHTVYRVTERPTRQDKDVISYDRLVELLFEAEHVVAW